MALLAFIVLAFLPSSIEYGISVSVQGTPTPLLYLLAVAAMLIMFPRIFAGVQDLPEVLFLFVYVAVHSIIVIERIDGNGWHSLLKGFGPMLAYVVVVGSRHRFGTYDDVIKTSYRCLALVAAYAVMFSFFEDQVGQYIEDWGELRVSSGIEGVKRASLPFGGPNLIGGLLSILFPVFFAQFLSAKGQQTRRWGPLGTVMVPMMLTFSRGTYLMMGLQGLWVVLVSNRRMAGILFLIAIVLLVGVSGIASSRLLEAEELDLFISEDSTSLSLRLATYQAMVQHVLRDPVGTGIGIDFVRDRTINEEMNESYLVTLIPFDGHLVMYQSHSAWLLVLVELGWMGGILMLSVWGAMFLRLVRATRIAKARGDADFALRFHAMQAAVVTFAGWQVISDGLYYNFRFAMMAWAALGLFAGLALNYAERTDNLDKKPETQPI